MQIFPGKSLLVLIVLIVFSEYTGTGSASPCKEMLYSCPSCDRRRHVGIPEDKYYQGPV